MPGGATQSKDEGGMQHIQDATAYAVHDLAVTLEECRQHSLNGEPTPSDVLMRLTIAHAAVVAAIRGGELVDPTCACAWCTEAVEDRASHDSASES